MNCVLWFVLTLSLVLNLIIGTTDFGYHFEIVSSTAI